MDLRTDSLPKTALGYYVKLYSKKIDKCKNEVDLNEKQRNLVAEATKSWLKLNSKKRKIILAKFNSHRLKFKKRFANMLRDTGPFSKSRLIKETSTVSIPIDDSRKLNNVSNLNSSSTNVDISDNTNDADNSVRDDLFNNTNVNTTLVQMNNCHNKLYKEITSNFENAKIVENCRNDYILAKFNGNEVFNKIPLTMQLKYPALLLEPTPPQFRCSREFYNLINKNCEDTTKWKNITPGEKSRYDRTVSRIRDNYLTSYMSFLESLSPIELYTYYKHVILSNDSIKS